jgi:signal transduction histidine kinase
MKQLFRIGFIFTIIMVITLGFFIIFNSENHFEERDLLYYNDQLHIIEEALANGEKESNLESKYKCHIIYAKEIEDEELSRLYKNNALVLDLMVNGEYIGKVAWDDNRSNFDLIKRGFFGGTVYLWVIMLLSGYILLILFHLSFVKPVKELQKFSEEIAKGNLDEPLPIKKNNLFGNFVEAFDQMREELRDSRKREVNAEVARKEMVTDLSHDIKTPISVIKVACEVLEAKSNKKLKENSNSEDEKKDIEYTLEKVSTISQKADLISSLMTNVMHSTLDDIDKISVNPVETDSRILKDFFVNLKNYGNIIIENDVPPCLVYMDRLRMEQVIDNVVGNSNKYAGTDIRVNFSETSALSSDGESKENFVRITIKDSGKGVKEDELSLITQKYFRGSNSNETSGYGLGMYLVKRYMEMQLGGMEYFNDNGFTVQLLLKKL